MNDQFSNIWGDLSNRVGLSTIRDCSRGGKSDSEYMVSSEKEAIKFDFDGTKDKSAIEVLMAGWFHEWEKKGWQKTIPKGVDCLYIQNGKLFLVEFKNQTKVDNKDVKIKIHDTLALLSSFYSIERSEFSQIEIILIRKFKSTSSYASKKNMRDFVNKKANFVPRFSTHMDFLQKVYQTKISVLSPTDYEKLIETPNDSEVVVCTQ